jgi:hypothetical protein
MNAQRRWTLVSILLSIVTFVPGVHAQEPEEYTELPPSDGVPQVSGPEAPLPHERVEVAKKEKQGGGYVGNIRQGDIRYNGGLSLSMSDAPGVPGTFEVSTGAAYFVIDRLAMGADVQYSKTSGEKAQALLGPTVTYHFWNEDKLSSHVNAMLGFGLKGQDLKNRTSVALGLDYFAWPSAALGPELEFQHYDLRGSDDYNRFVVAFGTGLYF